MPLELIDKEKNCILLFQAVKQYETVSIQVFQTVSPYETPKYNKKQPIQLIEKVR